MFFKNPIECEVSCVLSHSIFMYRFVHFLFSSACIFDLEVCWFVCDLVSHPTSALGLLCVICNFCDNLHCHILYSVSVIFFTRKQIQC